MINIFQGSLGSGKSASMVVDMCEHLMLGGVVAANFTLVPHWAEYLSSLSWRVRFGFVDRAAHVASLRSRFRFVNSLDDVWQASSDLIPLAERTVAKQREGRGRLYLDECQEIFNCRQWADNRAWIHFFSQSRKLRWDIVLTAHSVTMIDKQIRPFLEFETRFRNMAQVKFLGLIPVAPKSRPMFLAITRYAGISAGAGEIHSRRLYPLSKGFADLYDSHLVFGDKAAAVGLAVPPERCEARPAKPHTSPIPRKQWGICNAYY